MPYPLVGIVNRGLDVSELRAGEQFQKLQFDRRLK